MATSQQHVPQEKSSPRSLVAKYDKIKKKQKAILAKIHANELCVASAKSYIVKKRKATWGWQDKIYVARTPTAYAEKRVKACSYLKFNARKWSKRADKNYRTYTKLNSNPRAAICHIFGSYCSQALTVSWCEGRHYIWAHNGQYLGMFQMGSSERATYGHGNTALEQAYSAHKYFVASGRDWSPWSCKP